MAKINVDKFYLALLTKDEIGTGNLTFADPEYIYGIQSFQAKTKTNSGENYAEGILTDTNSTLQNVELTIGIDSFTNAQRTKYLGHHEAVTGGSFSSGNDEAPYLAVLIEYTKANNKKGFKVFYKGKLEEPDDSIKQKEGKIDYQSDSVTATFLPLKNNGMWKYTVEEDDPNCPADIENLFFSEVMIPVEKTADVIPTLALSSIVPAKNATGIVAGSNIVLTFNNAIAENNIFVIDTADGSTVATANSFDATKKILTINPNADLATGKKYGVVISGVKDIYGQALASTVSYFTIA